MEHPPNSTGSPTLVRRKYSAEFKASVVEQCSQAGNTTAAVAKRHGIHVSLVRRWAQLMRQAAQKHHAALPAGVPSGQLGPRALALVGTLAGQFHLTQRKVQAVLSHIMGIHFSLGAVSQAHGLVSQALEQPVAQLHHELLQHAPVRHADTRHQSHSHTLWRE